MVLELAIAEHQDEGGVIKYNEAQSDCHKTVKRYWKDTSE